MRRTFRCTPGSATWPSRPPKRSSTWGSRPCSRSPRSGLLVLAARSVGPLFAGDTSSVALEVLDTLLLVFIVVELLFAVRVTVAKRELLAEPFLLAGIIASIKEIIVLSVKAAEQIGEGAVFRDQMWEIGVLGVLVLLLGLTAFLLRRKEREPGEGDDGSPYSSDEGENPDR